MSRTAVLHDKALKGAQIGRVAGQPVHPTAGVGNAEGWFKGQPPAERDRRDALPGHAASLTGAAKQQDTVGPCLHRPERVHPDDDDRGNSCQR